MNVVIASKTRTRNSACVGAYSMEDARSLRLMLPGGFNQPVFTAFDVGQVWELEFVVREDRQPPHVEDVCVYASRYLRDVPHARHCLENELALEPWQGGPERLFDGALSFTSAGRGYVCRERPIPECSTGLWRADRDLVLGEDGGRAFYHDGERFSVPYVGFEAPQKRLRAGTLVRVSLARWWQPTGRLDAEPRCYLQLSGWYED